MMATLEENLVRHQAEPPQSLPDPSAGSQFEADYDEDRPISLLAERRREFQRAVQGRFVDADLPAVG